MVGRSQNFFVVLGGGVEREYINFCKILEIIFGKTMKKWTKIIKNIFGNRRCIGENIGKCQKFQKAIFYDNFFEKFVSWEIWIENKAKNNSKKMYKVYWENFSDIFRKFYKYLKYKISSAECASEERYFGP